MSIVRYNPVKSESFSLKAPPPTLQLKVVLEKYPEGTQIFKEGLQNAEDAKASCFELILDARKHKTNVETLDRFSGASLILYNDAKFSDKDWISLQNMFQSCKVNEICQIGKFGMGSRSYFHLSDVIQIISGSYYAYLDPSRILSVDGGEKINYVDIRNLPENCSDSILNEHLTMFNSVKSFCPKSYFNGTMFRLPLRSGRYADASEFAPYEYTHEKVYRMLTKFSNELHNCLVFLNSVVDIRISLFEQFNETTNELAHVNKHFLIGSVPPALKMYPSSIANLPETSWGRYYTSNILIQYSRMKTKSELISYVCQNVQLPKDHYFIRIRKYNKKVKEKEYYYMIASEIISNHSIISLIETLKEVPNVSIALPLVEPNLSTEGSSHSCRRYAPFSDNGYSNESMEFESLDGKLFCFLPLQDNESLGIPIHIHANFCLQDNRRWIWTEASDLVGQGLKWVKWNQLLMSSSADILLDSLSFFQDYSIIWKLLPRQPSNRPYLKPLFERLEKIILTNMKLTHCEQDGDKIVYSDKYSLSEFTLVSLSPKAETALDILFDQINHMPESIMSQLISREAMTTQLSALLSLITRKRFVVIPKHVTVLIQKQNPKLKIKSFLTVMYTYVIGYWKNHMSYSQLLNEQKYFVQWMFVLTYALGNGDQNEMMIFKAFCSHIPFIPIKSEPNKKEVNVLSDEIATSDTFVKAQITHHIELLPYLITPLSNCSPYGYWSLIAPENAFDPALSGFKVAQTKTVKGLLSTNACLKVLRYWGIRITLGWTDMTQEIAYRFCSINQITDIGETITHRNHHKTIYYP